MQSRLPACLGCFPPGILGLLAAKPLTALSPLNLILTSKDSAELGGWTPLIERVKLSPCLFLFLLLEVQDKEGQGSARVSVRLQV